MPAFLALLPESSRAKSHTHDCVVVVADNAAEALQVANDSAGGADTFLIGDIITLADSTTTVYTGLTVRVTITGAASGNGEDVVIEYEAADDDTADLVGAGLVAAAVARFGAGAATYVAGTNTLTFVGSVFPLGDGTVVYEVFRDDVALTNPSTPASVTDGGSAADDVVIVLPADNVVIPNAILVTKTRRF